MTKNNGQRYFWISAYFFGVFIPEARRGKKGGEGNEIWADT